MPASPFGDEPIRLLFVVTHGMTARLLMRGQMCYLISCGFRVAVAASPGSDLDELIAVSGPGVYGVPMTRSITPIRDLRSLAALRSVIRDFDPHIVHVSTPKAGLLGAIAAWLEKVPVRLYLLRGLQLETSVGWRRRVLLACERTTCRLVHRVFAVGESVRARAVALGVCAAERIGVLGAGSSGGVDVERFRPAESTDAIRTARRELGLPQEGLVIGFVGRLTRDKGVEDLARVFLDHVAPRRDDVSLVLVGDFEEGDPVVAPCRARLQGSSRVVLAGFREEPEAVMRTFDLLAFPSYREGLPNVPLEAAASAVPVVGYRATGTVDAVVEGVSGTLVETGDVEAFSAAILAYLDDAELRARHGVAGRS